MWEFVGWIAVWLIIHLFTAIALLGLTLASFNHCVGRMGTPYQAACCDP
jgi:hypothetical protein